MMLINEKPSKQQLLLTAVFEYEKCLELHC